MTYVDGFVLLVPTKKLPEYKKMASVGRKVWKEHGALDYKECVGDDLKTDMGLPFPKLTKAKKNETVVFSYIVYKSKADRDKILKKVMKDKRLAESCDGKNMPFDVKKMSFGGFKTLVE